MVLICPIHTVHCTCTVTYHFKPIHIHLAPNVGCLSNQAVIYVTLLNSLMCIYKQHIWIEACSFPLAFKSGSKI